MIFYISQFMQAILLPPGCIILIAMIGLLLWRYAPLFGKLLVTLSLASLWILSTPSVAQLLADKLQFKYRALLPQQLTNKITDAAIVVLEADINPLTPEYEKPTVSNSTLIRIRYAAYLHQKTGIPIMVSGNNPANAQANDAKCMVDALNDYFHTPTRWIEDKGYNTAQEGLFATEILKKENIHKIYLVTHALHMPRSLRAFENKGLEIIPAPTGYIPLSTTMGNLSNFLPNIGSLYLSSIAIHEYIGLLWYQIYYRV